MNSCLTEFSEELYKKGVFEEGRVAGLQEGHAAGLQEASTKNARNLFENGVSFDIVRISVENLSDEQLQKIYDEVMAKKMNK